MLEICMQTSYDQNVQLILKSYLPVVYGTTLTCLVFLLLTAHLGDMQFYMPHNIRMAKMPRCSVYWQNLSTFKPVYKGHSREPENVPFMCIALYLQFRSIYALFINWKNETAFYRQWFVIERCLLRQVWLYLIPFNCSLRTSLLKTLIFSSFWKKIW